MDEQAAYQQLKNKLGDKLWRLNNLYYIKDKQGNKIKFNLNWAQNHYRQNMHHFNVILKARQLGFSTFTLIDFLDNCLFNSNQAAGVIADIKENAEDLFDNKVKFAYDNLPDSIKKARTAEQDSARKLIFNNGSSFTVGTSLRGGTYQMLLISEYGKISAKFPDKAREIKTGALNTVEAGQLIVVESTAEGKGGEFFELCETARKFKNEAKPLTRLDPKFHFYAWFENPDYKLTDAETANTVIPKDTELYLNNIGTDFTPNQRAWYAAKEKIMGDDMRREYPSTPEEAFEGSLEGAFYTKQMAEVRKLGHITSLPYDSRFPVDTFWDLGGTLDQSSIIYFQEVNNQIHFIDYDERTNMPWAEYAKVLKDKPYNYGTHYWPHDGGTRIVGTHEVLSRKEMAMQVGIRPIEIVPVTKSVYTDITNYCQPILPNCWFDESKCVLLVNRLDNYRRKWDKINAGWMNDHVHDIASHGSDAFRTFAVARNNLQKKSVESLTLPGYHTLKLWG